MYKKIILVILSLSLIFSTAYATTWSDISSLIERHSTELKSAQKAVDSSLLSYQQAYTSFFPQLSGSLSYSQSTTSTSSAFSQYSYGLTAQHDLFSGGSSIFAMQSAYASYQSALATLKRGEADVYYNALKAYNNLLVAQEEIKIQTKIVAKRKENSRLINLSYLSGREDRGNLLQTEADQASAEHKLATAKRSLALAKLRLFQIVGVDIDFAEEFISPKILADEISFEALLQQLPEYNKEKAAVDLASINQKSATWSFLPSLSLSGTLRKTGSSWPPETDSSSWTLGLSYPFLNSGSDIFAQIINNVKLDQAKLSLEQFSKESLYTLQESYLNLEDALEGLRVAKTYATATEERAKIAQAKYLNGLISYDEWYRIENDYISSQGNYLLAKSKALDAEALWYRSYGGILK